MHVVVVASLGSGNRVARIRASPMESLECLFEGCQIHATNQQNTPLDQTQKSVRASPFVAFKGSTLFPSKSASSNDSYVRAAELELAKSACSPVSLVWLAFRRVELEL